MNFRFTVELLEDIEKINELEFVEACRQVFDFSDYYQKKLGLALFATIQGHSQKMNDWLFTLPPDYADLVVWLSKVKDVDDQVRYIWIVGNLDPQLVTIRTLIEKQQPSFVSDEFLKMAKFPPFLLYINELAASEWQKNGGDSNASDLSLYQSEYEGVNVLEDIDQKMSLNGQLLVERFEIFKQRSFKASAGLYECLAELDRDEVGLITKLHAELHNYGHFVGSWVQGSSKNNPDYQAVEEFKACLASMVMVEYLDISEKLKIAYVANVLATRIFGYGLDAFRSWSKRSEPEMTTGLLFFQTFAGKGISIKDNQLSFNFARISDEARIALARLNDFESKAKEYNLSSLTDVAKSYYRLAYPNRKLPPTIEHFYKLLVA
jgi:hypothetical protein